MELPEDVICLIREFSKPITRFNWRTLGIMTDHQFHMAAMKRFSRHFYDDVCNMQVNCIIHYRYMVFNTNFYYISPNV